LITLLKRSIGTISGGLGSLSGVIGLNAYCYQSQDDSNRSYSLRPPSRDIGFLFLFIFGMVVVIYGKGGWWLCFGGLLMLLDPRSALASGADCNLYRHRFGIASVKEGLQIGLADIHPNTL
jgi:hypothetical protein